MPPRTGATYEAPIRIRGRQRSKKTHRYEFADASAAKKPTDTNSRMPAQKKTTDCVARKNIVPLRQKLASSTLEAKTGITLRRDDQTPPRGSEIKTHCKIAGFVKRLVRRTKSTNAL
ncbi:hypothetical protein [Paraburkholderia sabiae]|uniref:hypothetical protein n=1 Tax=Paraburkholderia sabiae TaxID=273251 RepID=UPI001CC37392|nr:hypothetical protein [Paraburkholderia sabiae]